MGETAFFRSRIIGDPVRTLDVRCEYLRWEHKPDIVQRGAGGAEQRSVQPYILTLFNVEPEDLAAMQSANWTHVGWNEDDRQIECAAPTIQVLGTDVRCVYRP